MPRIPYDLPQVSQQVPGAPRFQAPGVQAPGNATGDQLQGLGQGIQRAAMTSVKVAAEAQDRHDESRVLQADNLLAESDRQALMEFGNLRGQAAFGKLKEVQDRQQETRRKLLEGLTTPEQKAAFEGVSSRRWNHLAGAMAMHADRESRSELAGELKAGIDSGIADYAEGLRSGSTITAAARNTALQRVDQWVKTMGMGPEQAKAARLDVTGRMHAGAIDVMLSSGRTSEARSYLEANGAEMPQDVALRASKLVRTVSVAEDGAKAVNVAVASALDDMAGSMAKQGRSSPSEFDMLTMMDDASKRLGSADLPFDVKESALDRLRGQRAEMLQRNAQSAVASLNESVKWLGANPGKSLADLQQVRPDIYNAIADSGDLPRLQAVHEKQQDQLAYGEASQISDDELRKLSEPELTRRFWGRLSATDMGTLAARHRVANGKATGKDKKVVSDEDRIAEAFHAASMLPRNKALDDAGKQRLYLFKTRVQAKLDGLGDIDDKRFQGVLDEAAMDKAFIVQSDAWLFGIPGTEADWMDSDTPSNVSTMLPDEQSQAYVEVGGEKVYLTQLGAVDRTAVPTVGPDAGDRILQSEREKIIADLRAKGRPVTEAEIARLWVAGGKQGRK